MASWVLAVALALSPVAVPSEPVDAPPPSTAEILALPDPLREQFRRYTGNQPRRAEERLEQVVEFLFDNTTGLGLEYHYDATYTVAEVYATRHVNCLSFSLITIALAREAGLESYAQEIDDVLTWFQEGNTVFRNNHVNVGVRIGQQRFSADVAWDEVIARQEPRRIDDTHLFALYYNNRAVGLLTQGKPALARIYTERALQLSPEYPPFWSNAGVIALREGKPELAESSYKHAIALKGTHSPALFNLISLYTRNGRQDEARPLEKQLARIRARDPFDQFLLALERERTGDYASAIEHYQRAIRLFAKEHRFYEGLARAYLLQGDARRAGRALEQARELSKGSERARYQAKLELLRKKQIEQPLFGPQPRRH